MSVIQTLDYNLRDAEDQELIWEDLEIFSKLARLNGRDVLTGKEVITREAMRQSVGRLVMGDLDLDFDAKALMPYNTSTGYYNLDLSPTDFDMDEQANIYYMYYGVNLIKPNYQQGPVIVPGGFRVNGFESYWQNVDDGFVNIYFPDAPDNGRKIPFTDSFHVMAMVYLAINGYESYEDAKKNKFEVHGAG